jgi:hypothetical protein
MISIEGQEAFCSEMDALSGAEKKLKQHIVFATKSKRILTNELISGRKGILNV